MSLQFLNTASVALQAVGALLLGGEGAKARLGVIGAVVLARTLLQVSAPPLFPAVPL